MVVYNAASKELTAKIVYYGTGFGGKTTNLQFLHRRLEPSSVGNLLTLAATADRTIFFDLLPVELGDLKGYRIRFQVATVPGQSPYNETRRVVLRGADGIVFVVDSRWSQLPKNLESLQNLRENLKAEGIDPATLPFTVQFNKRDLPDVLAIDALQEGLGLAGFPFIEAVASEGKGVVETFKLISKLTFVDILRRLQKKGPPKPARAAAHEAENLSAWKTSMVHGQSAIAPEPARTARVLAPEPLAFEPEDSGATQAIPTLVRPFPPPSAAAAEPPPAPFAFDEEEAAAPAPADERERADAVVFETFPPSPEPAGITEDTNPAFFERRPAGAPAPVEFPAPADRASTASFAPPDAPAETAAFEITAPMAFPVPDEAAPAEKPSRTEEPEPIPAAPEPIPAAAAPAPEPPSPAPSPADAAAERLDRMIQLAVASTWGDRLSAAEEKLAAGEALAERVTTVETGLASHGETPARLAELDRRIAAAEGSRGWTKDLDLLRTDWTNARLAADDRMTDLKRALSEIAQSL
ncbi:MAG TPA: hypothetical protein VG777_00455, partial [Thermoanaerobaculia bacterium]|nr:hypothetical protein [Thermoanaerobaculia bacterium]